MTYQTYGAGTCVVHDPTHPAEGHLAWKRDSGIAGEVYVCVEHFSEYFDALAADAAAQGDEVHGEVFWFYGPYGELFPPRPT